MYEKLQGGCPEAGSAQASIDTVTSDSNMSLPCAWGQAVCNNDSGWGRWGQISPSQGTRSDVWRFCWLSPLWGELRAPGG